MRQNASECCRTHWSPKQVFLILAAPLLYAAFLVALLGSSLKTLLLNYIVPLESLVNSLPMEKILITMQSNAKSKLWHADITDEKGMLVEEFVVLENYLTISNQPNIHPLS